jgi:hypothetical protein
MVRQLTVLTIFLSLLLAACTPGASTQELTPTVQAEQPTAAPTEVPAEEPTNEPTEEQTEEPTEEPEAETETGAEPTAVAEEESDAESESAEALAGCPEPEDEMQLISSTVAGYCFLIPAGFERSPFGDDDGFSLGIYGPESTPGHRERAFVNVTEITTPTIETTDETTPTVDAQAHVESIVEGLLASLPGFTPTQSSLTLGGLPAIQLDNLPGQDINRKIFAVYEDRLYELTFVPVDEVRPDASAEMEELYALVVESFRFMPATDAASSFAPMLTWEGEIDGACHTLTIEPDGTASVGVCDDEASSTTSLSENVEWAAVQEHFGNIDAETSAGQITFQGQGSAANEDWAQALATWASFTAMETVAGRTGASARTALAWQLTTTPEHSGLCSQLIVLAYGYAYANQIPCDGNGQATQVATGWLTDAELDTLAGWLAGGERVEGELGYLDAQGDAPITPEELTAWANAVYTRMLQ